MDIDTVAVLELVRSGQWLALTALFIGLLIRVLKMPVVPAPLSAIPAKARPLVALLLGIASGILQAVIQGAPLRDALLGGVVSAALAVLGHDLGIEWLRGGRELGAPAPAPPKPLRIEEPASVQVPEAAPTPRDGSYALLPRAPRLEDIDGQRGGS